MSNKEANTRPFLRWAGSKKQLLGQLREYLPEGDVRYVEPFAGSACLFFDIRPSSAVLGDINGELIRTYRAVKSQPGQIIECLQRLRVGRRAYYRIRSMDPAGMLEAERAARFIYLNKYCFNGIYRTNRRGDFNVPFGDTKGADRIDPTVIVKASGLLQDVQFVSGDFEDTLRLARRGDFVYMDPPYSTQRRRIFAEYDPGSFGADDLQRLSQALRELDRKGIPFLVSYAHSPEGREVLREWPTRRVRVRRHISGFAKHRRHAYELLASNRR